MSEPSRGDWESVAATVDNGQALLWSLVLEAVAIPHRIEPHGAEWRCLTAVADAAEAQRQLGRFEEENRHWPPPRIEADRRWQRRRPPTLLLMGALLCFYVVTGPWQEESRWFAQGAIDGTRIWRDHQWWRLLTALVLHAGPVHLFGNFCFGTIFVHYICKAVGVGMGWALVLLSGVLGNLLNVLVRSGDHHAVGFSTAVFGAVGILCGLELRTGSRRAALLPIGGGVGLLALLGVGGERTDLGAHFWGLAAGFLLGLLWSRLPDRCRRLADSATVQTLVGLLCVAALWGSWHLALL